MLVNGRESAVGNVFPVSTPLPTAHLLQECQTAEKIRSGRYLYFAGSCDPRDVVSLPLWEHGGEEQDKRFF